MLSPKHILIVDAHEITRHGYIYTLRAWRKGLLFGEAGSYREALQLVPTQEWDLVILELCMPGRGGLEFLDQLQAMGVTSPILVSSLSDEESFGIRAIRRGVAGYISKGARTAEFISAVDVVLQGKKYISPSMVQSLMRAMHPSNTARAQDLLSDREFQVLQQLARGVTIKQMAMEMCLSVKTVSTYRTRIMQKLGLTSMVALIQYCFEHQLTSTREAEQTMRSSKAVASSSLQEA
jgi:two-component system invasion response regulator UvrY